MMVNAEVKVTKESTPTLGQLGPLDDLTIITKFVTMAEACRNVNLVKFYISDKIKC